MIYLDHNATTPIAPEVVQKMEPWLARHWGNPSSVYSIGREARQAIERARENVAAVLQVLPWQICFTSSATEANNAALHSAVFRDRTKRHLVTSLVEHSSVLAYCNYLEQTHGIEVTRLPVNADGALDSGELRRAIREDTAIVSLMWANNETGVVWPIAEFADICAERDVHFHTDAVQAVGKIPLSLRDTNIGSLTVSGHKIGAPKGIGALFIRDPDSFRPLLHGGKQEKGLRGGTENVSHIVGLGAAAGLLIDRGLDVWNRVASLRDQFEANLTAKFDDIQIHGRNCSRLPNTTNIRMPWIDGDGAVTYLDGADICVSSGSACLESAITPSHVLLAMTGSYEAANESIRVSLGRNTTEGELKRMIEALQALTVQLR